MYNITKNKQNKKTNNNNFFLSNILTPTELDNFTNVS